MSWQRITIQTGDGEQEAIAPEIISASRSTDIPAFYADWFIARLAAGYCKWVNPFNAKPQYVSFKNIRAIVFWTKNPSRLIPYLPVLDKRGLTYYFQFTVNDYEDQGLEPKVPPLQERVKTFQRLSELIGKKRVIWRFDPLILTESLTVDNLVEKVRKVGNVLHPYTEKLVFSFADIGVYAKVRHSLHREGIKARDFSFAEMQTCAQKLVDVAREWNIKLCTCAEEIDLKNTGIYPNRCVDDELLLQLAPRDAELAKVLGRIFRPVSNLFGELEPSQKNIKDTGQREACGCVVSKDIGQYNTCGHLCRYCYANTSEEAVRRNRERLSQDSDSIVV